MSCLFYFPEMKIFEKYVKGSAKNLETKKFYSCVKGSAPLRSLPPAHALENGF